MRKVNAILGIFILAAFLCHAVIGAGEMTGLIDGGNMIGKVAAHAMVTALFLHIIIGVKLTADTLIAIKRSGANYFKDNLLFWTRRISGFAMIFFIIAHYLVFIGDNSSGVYRLNEFGVTELVMAILLIVSLLIHIITNIRPLMLALGSSKGHRKIAAAVFTASVILLLLGGAFVVYFIRWLA